MTDGGSPLVARIARGLDEVEAGSWDACAGDDNPFVSHAFLKSLEDSGSVGGRTGWLPAHMLVQKECGALVAAAPLYVKVHSYGEYVFDHAWAAAYERAGGAYYPKLQMAIPFTPVTGPRLLVRPDADPGTAAALLEAIETFARRQGVSSVHATFPTEAEWTLMGEAGWLLRKGQQYHWLNRGYGSFDDFLADLHANKRKTIRKERRAVAETGVRLHCLTGDDIKPQHWDAFHDCYIETSDGKWGYPYLTRAFFHHLGARLAHRVVLFMAEEDGRWIAGALNLRGTEALYGRNWGCLRDHRFLHFEACYYRAIDFAIEHGLRRVEAGAQGEHKVLRGYLPHPTYSAHWVRDRGFRRILERVLAEEREAVDETMDALTDAAPFRKTC